MRFTLLVPIFAAVVSVVAGGGGGNHHNHPHPSPKPCKPTPQCPPFDKKGNPLVKSSIKKIGYLEYRVCEFKPKKKNNNHNGGGGGYGGGHHRREAIPSPVADPEDDLNELWARGDEDGMVQARDLETLEEWAKRGGHNSYETEECYYLKYNGKLVFGDKKTCRKELELGGCPSPRRRSADEMAQAQVVRDYYEKRARRGIQL